MLAGTAGVVVLIIVQADIRRRQLAIELAAWHAETLAERMADTGLLPLNLEPRPEPDRQSRLLRLEWPSRDRAWLLRRIEPPLIAAHTAPVPRRLMPDGRAVIRLTPEGRFDVEWMSLDLFAERYARQRAALDRLQRDDDETAVGLPGAAPPGPNDRDPGT